MHLYSGDYSPWGEIQFCEKIVQGYYLVETAGHGGIMVDRSGIMTLSAEAMEIGFYDSGYLCFEEDCDAAIVFKELMTRSGWDLPRDGMMRYSCSLEEFEKSVDSSIEHWHPEYYEAKRHLFEKQIEFELAL